MKCVCMCGSGGGGGAYYGMPAPDLFVYVCARARAGCV